MRILSMLLAACVFAVAQEQPAPQAAGGWHLVWSDEFEGPVNSSPDSTKWNFDLGAGGWGNRELQTYTRAPENVFQDGNGNLVIRVLNPSPSVYTSARLKTQGRFTVHYGKVEARIKIPYGQGIWPAFWMLGANITTVGWPRCGEIDIMENIGKEPALVHGTIHGPGYSGGRAIGAPHSLPGGRPFHEEFHRFAVVWTPRTVEFSVDDVPYKRINADDIPAGSEWVLNTPFFLLLNVAVGGNWPGNPDATTTFPQVMTVDYVRVYRHQQTRGQ